MADIKKAYWEGRYPASCSNCHCDAPHFLSGSEWKEDKTPYCPGCGAKMEDREEPLPVQEVIKGIMLEREHLIDVIGKDGMASDVYTMSKRLIKIYNSAIQYLEQL